MEKKRSYKVPAVEKALDIIELIWRIKEASFSEIYTQLKLPKTSTYQILNTLESRGYVRHAGESTKYVLGLRLYELGNAAISDMDIRLEAIPIVRDLMMKTNQVCHLGIIDGTDGVYLAKMDTRQTIRINTWEGMRVPLPCTATGKVLLAWREENFVDEILVKVGLPLNTMKSITDINEFKKHLQIVRDRGWAFDDEEFQEHIRCIAAPVVDIRGEVIASVSISGVNYEMVDSSVLKFAGLVKDAADELSKKLGGKVPRHTHTERQNDGH